MITSYYRSRFNCTAVIDQSFSPTSTAPTIPLFCGLQSKQSFSRPFNGQFFSVL